MKRRSFLSAPVLGTAFAAQVQAASADNRVYAYGDGIPHSPAEYAALLTKLSQSQELAPDDYSRGGEVEKLEVRMAQLLGKETAIWLPTGTMANHMAVRLLAGAKRRVLVQAESHLYRDSGDCAQTLSGLHLIPLAPGKAALSLEDIEHASGDARLGRVDTPIGAIQIETPVRRRLGEAVDFNQVTRISKWAKDRGIGMHLDGARLFIESIYTGRPLHAYTALFDTVYASMSKYFNAGSGAILAGPKTLLAEAYHTRRMLGGGLPHVWQFAAVARHYAATFDQDFRAAVKTSEAALAVLAKDESFAIERIPNGTNSFRLRVASVNAPVYHLRLEEAGISARDPQGDWFTLQVNQTWSRVSSGEIVARFRKALG